mgnify:FL=1
MKFENLLIKTENNITTISINRPKKLNALNIKTFEEIANAVKLNVLNENTKCIIITGVGDKAFIAGADIKEFLDYNASDAYDFSENGNKFLFEVIENSTKPIIAMINGYALGGGLELAMACHIRVASDDSRMGLPEVSLGIIPGYGGTKRLPLLIGKGRAMEMIITGRMINAEEAKSFGLINYVVKKEKLTDFCNSLANKIILNSPNAIKHAINSLNSNYKEGFSNFSDEILNFSKCFDSDDFKEGTSAFLEKRKPNFK